MQLAEINDQTLTVHLTVDELGYLVNCMGEALQRVEDWEFETLIGTSRDEIRALKSTASEIYREVPAEPQT
jgi:hypothetical protein